MPKFFSLVLLALVGCGGSSTPSLPPTAGDFVTHKDHVGTAKVLGIDFSVHVNSGGVSTTDSIDADFIDTQQSSARKRFTFGDDISIQLDSLDESQVQFMLNDQDYGILNVGDKVVINDERTVEVNGNPRSPQAGE